MLFPTIPFYDDNGKHNFATVCLCMSQCFDGCNFNFTTIPSIYQDSGKLAFTMVAVVARSHCEIYGGKSMIYHGGNVDIPHKGI